MSDFFLSCLGLALTASVMAGLLRVLGWKGVPVYISITALAIFSLFGETLSQVFFEINTLAEAGGVSQYAEGALKIMAVGFISGIVCDILSEMGEGTIAKAVSSAAKIEIVAISLPYFKEIVNTGLEFLA